MRPEHIIKRDDALEEFDVGRIAQAIKLAQKADGHEDGDLADELAEVVAEQLESLCDSDTARVEDVQDAVIQVLQESGNYRLAQAYLRYRDARERERRINWAERDQKSVEPNLRIIGRDARSRSWDRERLRASLQADYALPVKLADDVMRRVELMLAETLAEDLPANILLSFIDAALCQCGAHQTAIKQTHLRMDTQRLDEAVLQSADGEQLLQRAGGEVLEQWSLADRYPNEVMRLYSCGRLWIDGMNDPLRGSQFISNFAGRQDHWEVMSRAFVVAVEAKKAWRECKLILPPMILGHLEREDAEAGGLAEALETLSHLAQVYLYCDGRTPLLNSWPLRSKNIGLAIYEDDFLLQGRLQELGLPLLTGAFLNQEGYRRRVAVRLALNAQGLDDNHGRMDHLAMAVVAAARVRLQQLKRVNPDSVGAEVRFSIFGLPPSSSSNQYLERQVIQEGLREGVALSRSANLCYEACEHLARLFE